MRIVVVCEFIPSIASYRRLTSDGWVKMVSVAKFQKGI